MKTNAYAVQDIKADRFNVPFFITTHGEAIRVFGDNCQNKESLWNKHPEDFRLYHLGTFDDKTGELQANTIITLLSRAIDWQSVTQESQVNSKK